MKAACLVIAILACLSAYSQKDVNNLDQLIEDNIETIASGSDAELDYNTLLDKLIYFKEHPLNLNVATREDLEGLMLLNALQIQALLEHIKEYGKLIALEELQTIDGFDITTIYRILPYVKINDNAGSSKLTFRRVLNEGKGALLIRYQEVLEDSKGFLPENTETGDTNRYLGSKVKLYSRFRYQLSNQFSFGITGQKDAGEQFFKGTQQSGFDFYSFHLYYHGNRILKSFVIGDYVLQYGQGLTLGSGLTFGKSYDVMNFKKNAAGISPYISTNENTYMRGAAISMGGKNITLDMFYSKHRVDANIELNTALTDEIASSLETSGYHRTYAELADKHSLGETLYGAHLQYRYAALTIGVTDYETLFDKDLSKTYYPYNQFEFSGDHNRDAGIDYNYIYKNVNLFGEVSKSANGGISYVNGALVSLDSRVGISILHRHYDKDYQNLFSNAFSEGAGNANEDGLIFGIVTKPAQNVTLSGYYDQFAFPWLRYLVNAPSVGNDYMIQLLYTPVKTFEAYIRIRTKNKPADLTSSDQPIDPVAAVNQTSYRFNIRYKVSNAFTFGNRVEYVTYTQDVEAPEKGFLIYQDITYKRPGSRITASFRYEIFDTDSYNARIYTYENDVLYAYSIPFLYNRGSRFYCLIHYRLVKNVDSWLRYSITAYDNVSTISSGLDQINGNQKSDVSVQLRFQF